MNIQFQKNFINYVYFALTIFVFLFFSIPGQISSAGSILVPYFMGSKQIIVFFLSFLVIILFLVLFRFNFYLDFILILLFFRTIIYLIHLLFSVDQELHYGHFLSIVIPLFSYFIGLQYKGSLYFFSLMYLLFSIIISIQTIYTSLTIGINLFDYTYKFNLVIPLTSSNVIAVFLLPSFYLNYNSKLSSIIKILNFLLFLSALILTSSRVAFVVLFLYCIFLYLSKKKIYTMSYYFLLTIFFFLILILIVVSLYFVTNGNLIYEQFFVFFNDLSTGRLQLFIDSFISFIENPIFGIGFTYGTINLAGSHNYIIDSLQQIGVFGIFFFLGPVYFLIKNLYIKDSIRMYGIKDLLMLFLFLGLFEVSFNFFTVDTIFWYFSALLLSQKNLKHGNIHKVSSYLT